MNDLLSLSGLARHLQLPSEWLRSEALAGRLPCLRAGRRLLFNADAVRRALLRRASEPGSSNDAECTGEES